MKEHRQATCENCADAVEAEAPTREMPVAIDHMYMQSTYFKALAQASWASHLHIYWIYTVTWIYINTGFQARKQERTRKGWLDA